MRILVIGGTQFIGYAVVRQLAADGHDVTVYNRGITPAELPDGVQRITGDRAGMAEARSAFASLQPDVVLDMRAMSEADARSTVNAVRGSTGRVVAISSMDVYQAYGRIIGTEPGPLEPLPLTEESAVRERLFPYRSEPPLAADDPESWRDNYDKLMVERVVLHDPELPGTILRLPMVYGPRDRQHRFRPFIKRMDDGRSVIPMNDGYAHWRSSWSYVDNVAYAIALAVTDEHAAGRIYNVAEPQHPTMAEIAVELADLVGWQGEIVELPEELLAAPLGTAQDLVASGERIRDELGYAERVPREDALLATIEWERSGPPAPVPAEFDYAREDELLARR
jgi:nucleoside-diphosphate-sugar epimerase